MKGYKIRERSISAAFILLCIAGGVMCNLTMDMLSQRYSLSVDMSAGGIYELSPQTDEVLVQLSAPVRINILMKEADFSTKNFYAQINEMLLCYRIRSGGNLTLRYVDVYANPGFLSAYADTELAEGSLVVESGKRYKALSINDLYQVQYDAATGEPYVQGMDAEQKLTSALLYVTSSGAQRAALLEGHGEQYSNRISTFLEDAGYEVNTLKLNTEEIPKDVTLLIMSAPSVDYTATDTEKLERFLNAGGDMLVFFSAYSAELPVLERYFEGWGVRVSRTVVVDQQNCLPGYPLQILAGLASGGIAQALQSHPDTPLLMPGSRSLELTGDGGAGWSVQPVLTSSANAYTKPLALLSEDGALERNPQDAAGPFNLAAVSQHRMTDGVNVNNSRILFAGTHLFTSDSLLNEPSWLNGAFLTECVNYVNEKTDAVTITPKQMRSSQLILSNEQTQVVFWVCVVGLPLAILAEGYAQWRKRRVL